MRKKRYWFLFYTTLVLFLAVGEASAEKKRGKRKRQKRVIINFEDELLQGSPSSPGFFNLLQKKEVNYGRLIKFRKNFLPEMRRTAGEI